MSFNLYAYCENNPVNLYDPTGNGPVGAIFGAILGYGLGSLILPRVADKMGLKGKTRKWFVRGGTAAFTLLGGYAGYYLGNAIASVYKAGGVFAGKVNQAIAKGISKLVGGTLTKAKGSGWIIKTGKLTLRVMSSGGGRTNYFRLSYVGKGAMTLSGGFSADRALTHINITFSNIIKIVNVILKNK